MSLFRPCIDLHDGKVKQIVGGTLSDSSSGLKTNFESERGADYFAGLYRRDGLSGGHVIMLGRGNDDAALSALRAYPDGLQVGGGINAGNAAKFLDAGASKVIVTSAVFRNGEIDFAALKELTGLIGKDRLVLDLSCRRREDKYWIVTDRWQKFTGKEVNSATLKELSGYCAEYLVHAVDVEGKQSGIDLALLRILADGAPIPVTYAGGISSFADIDLIDEYGRGVIDYTIGSALDIFGGALSYDAVVERNKRCKSANC